LGVATGSGIGKDRRERWEAATRGAVPVSERQKP
jgi:hypothetical protein